MSNRLNKASPSLNLLDHEQCEQIVQAAYQILQTTGVKVDHEMARDLYGKAGCEIRGDLIKISPQLIQQALATLPEKVMVYDRLGTSAMDLGGHNTYFGPGLTNTRFVDPFTGERRNALTSDVKSTALVVDALENIDFAMGLAGITDCPPNFADIVEMAELLKNTSKPLVGWSIDGKNSEIILKMVEIAAGGREHLVKRPFTVMYAGSCTSGLIHAENEIEKLIFWIENGIPCTYTGSGQLGVTAPIAMAGALAQGMAETLSIILLTQLVRPGAAFLSTCNPMTMDMKTTVTCYGAPETCMSYIAQADLHHYLNIPTFGIAGASESKIDDGQAAIENTLSLAASFFSGTNLVHDLGFLESGMTGSLVQLLIADETIGYLRHMEQGIEINEETLSLETIHRLGPGGNYLTEKETFQKFKKALWTPKLFDRSRRHEWEKRNSASLEKRASEKLIEILNTHQSVPLSETALMQLDSIVSEFYMKLPTNQ